MLAGRGMHPKLAYLAILQQWRGILSCFLNPNLILKLSVNSLNRILPEITGYNGCRVKDFSINGGYLNQQSKKRSKILNQNQNPPKESTNISQDLSKYHSIIPYSQPSIFSIHPGFMALQLLQLVAMVAAHREHVVKHHGHRGIVWQVGVR